MASKFVAAHEKKVLLQCITELLLPSTTFPEYEVTLLWLLRHQYRENTAAHNAEKKSPKKRVYTIRLTLVLKRR